MSVSATWRDEFGRTADELRRLWTAEAAAFPRWCEREWQTQRRVADPEPATPSWPTVADIKHRWSADSAPHLVQARELIENAAAGRELPPCEYAVLDPPPPPRVHWRDKYAPELAKHYRIEWDLLEQNGINHVLRRARLTPDEADVARLWLRGTSPQSIAAVLELPGRVVSLLLARNIPEKLAALRGDPPRPVVEPEPAVAV